MTFFLMFKKKPSVRELLPAVLRRSGVKLYIVRRRSLIPSQDIFLTVSINLLNPVGLKV